MLSEYTMGTYNKAKHVSVLIHRDTKMAIFKMFPTLKARTYDEALRILLASYKIAPV